MKVILEAQHAVGHPQLRGVGTYSLNLIKALLRRNRFNYELSFFDYKKEMGNRSRAENFFGEYNVPFHECNELDYRIASRDESVFTEKNYNDFTNTEGDIYHFLCPVSVPTAFRGKMVVTIHDIIWETYPNTTPEHTVELHKIAIERINRIQPFVIADSKATEKDILKFTNIPPEKIQTVYLSYDEKNMYPDKSDISNLISGEYFFFVGAFEKRKNLFRVIEAFDVVAEKNKDIKLAIAGRAIWDNSNEVYNKANSSPHKDRIVFMGYVDDDAKRKLYSNAEGLVFPSVCEGFGIPVLEAMACGCPVITADNTSLPEVGGDAAIYVNAYNTEQLAYEMNHLLNSKSLREEMTKKGFIQKNKFSWDKTAEQVEKFYERINMI